MRNSTEKRVKIKQINLNLNLNIHDYYHDGGFDQRCFYAWSQEQGKSHHPYIIINLHHIFKNDIPYLLFLSPLSNTWKLKYKKQNQIIWLQLRRFVDFKYVVHCENKQNLVYFSESFTFLAFLFFRVVRAYVW